MKRCEKKKKEEMFGNKNCPPLGMALDFDK
jgi:hypothetical protein